jgi:hypothetical protein
VQARDRRGAEVVVVPDDAAGARPLGILLHTTLPGQHGRHFLSFALSLSQPPPHAHTHTQSRAHVSALTDPQEKMRRNGRAVPGKDANSLTQGRTRMRAYHHYYYYYYYYYYHCYYYYYYYYHHHHNYHAGPHVLVPTVRQPSCEPARSCTHLRAHIGAARARL